MSEPASEAAPEPEPAPDPAPEPAPEPDPAPAPVPIATVSNVAATPLDQPARGISFMGRRLIWNSADDAKIVVDALNRRETVLYLNLEGNTLDVEAARAIGEALKRHPELQKALWKDIFMYRYIENLPLAMEHLSAGLMGANARLKVLDIRNNAFGPTGLGWLDELLRSPVCYSLQSLLLSKCDMGPEGGIMLSQALLHLHASAQRAGTPLQLLVFQGGHNRFENPGAKALAKAFKELKTLKEISLCRNEIKFRGVEALAQSFKENPLLQVLDLQDNILRVNGAGKLAEILPSLEDLRKLILNNCKIRTSGAFKLASALHNANKLLECVNIGCNQINTDGVVAFIGAFKDKPNLRWLNVDGNCLGRLGCERVIIAMGKLESDSSLILYWRNSCATVTEEGDVSGTDDEAEAEALARQATESFELARTFISKREACSLEEFITLGPDNKLEALMRVIDRFTEDKHMLLLVFTGLKCAHLSKESKEAFEVAISLFQHLFEYAIKANQVGRTVNYLLQQLRLKAVDLQKPPDFDVQVCQYPLREAITRPEFANDDIKQILKEYLKDDNVNK